MPYKFEKLEVWHLALDYLDAVYRAAGALPRSEEYNLRSQMTRAATSVALNIAEGSTGLTDTEQARFLGLGVRSLIETVACQHIIRRQKLLGDAKVLDDLYAQSERLFAKLSALRRTLAGSYAVREDTLPYEAAGPEETD